MNIPIFSKLIKARDKPKDYYSGSNYTYLFGPTTSGKNVNEYTAMQTTAVYACVRILSEALASLPLHVYKREENGKKRVYDHHLYNLLHNEPNSEMSSFVFRETLMSHLLIWGNAYAQIIRDGAGRVVALYPLLPNKMTVGRNKSGEIYYSYTRGSFENPNFDGCDTVDLKNMMYCIFQDWVLMDLLVIRQLQWQKYSGHDHCY